MKIKNIIAFIILIVVIVMIYRKFFAKEKIAPDIGHLYNSPNLTPN